MDDKTTNISKAKCHKIKNPCKICFQRVSHKNGLRCEGACKKWVHFECLRYTPGKIADIKAGVIRVSCPCPDCTPQEQKEVLTNPPYTCLDNKCPANQFPKCTSTDCLMNMEGEEANLNPDSKNQSGPPEPSPGTEATGPLPRCVANEPRPFKLCQQTSNGAIQIVANKPPDVSPDKTPDKTPDMTPDNYPDNSPDNTPINSPNTSCKAKLIALKDKISAFAYGRLCPEKESPQTSKDDVRDSCSPEACKNSAQNDSNTSPNPIGSNQSMNKVQFEKPRNNIMATPMATPKKSKSFAGPMITVPPTKTKRTHNRRDCPVSTSDSVIEVAKGQDSLVSALDEMCTTVVRLGAQIKHILCKLDGAR